MTDPLFTHEKRGGTVVVQVAEFRGARFLDLRLWVPGDGELRSTKKGVTLPLSCAKALGEALAALGGSEAT
jgi:hypothetical protein